MGAFSNMGCRKQKPKGWKEVIMRYSSKLKYFFFILKCLARLLREKGKKKNEVPILLKKINSCLNLKGNI